MNDYQHEANRNASVKDSFYSRFFARIYDPFMERMEARVLSKHRKRLLGSLSGNVLEVGSGTGINFPYYPSGCKVLASEPSAQMLRFAQNRIVSDEVQADISVVQAGVGSAELAKLIPANGFDAIVCTLVLCTIPDPIAAVRDFKKWLKPDGRLIVLEHVHAPDGARRALLKIVNPVWNVLAEGCHLTRDTAKMLRNEGLAVESEELFTKVLPFYVAVLKKNLNFSNEQ